MSTRFCLPLLHPTSVAFGVMLCASSLLSPALAANNDLLRVGAAKVDITPTTLKDMNPMGGDFNGVHDPIYMRTLLIHSGGNKVALVSVDAMEVGDTTAVRQRIEKELQIPFANILIFATHDHSAPRVGNVSPGAMAHEGTTTSLAWSEVLYTKMVEALRQSDQQAKPARFGVGKGTVNINVNRDEYTADGWIMGVNPTGPSDKGLWVMKFDSLDGQPIALLTNYAVHSMATLGIKQVTGDLTGVAADYVEKTLGGNVVSLWSAGMVADQNPRIFRTGLSDTDEKDAAFAWNAATTQGLAAGEAIVRVASAIKPSDMTRRVNIHAEEKVVSCPTQQGTETTENMNQAQVDNVDLRLGLVMLNDTAIAGVSGEVMTRIGYRLAKSSPLLKTILTSIVNDRIGYIPDDAAYPNEVFEVKASPLKAGCAEDAIVNNFTTMIGKALQRQQ
ncbi:neutral/alkaline non-lysosomal ceramidase N-terminal domain-containing protein [Lonsdalea quercina]|uniref:neutral/alkaline non-lysosomal ceramidase N-terminal domain-containing protein n=1 Tax=Lonsdalea quercina TaxID=71657 RepID=UPI0039764983